MPENWFSTTPTSKGITVGYHYSNTAPSHAHAYLLPTVLEVLESYFARTGHVRRVFDMGCGNGSVAAFLTQRGYDVTGVDPSAEGVGLANLEFPKLKIYQGSAYDDLAKSYGQFPVVISLEVVEHVYSPRQFSRSIFNLLRNDGIALISTPYHGYVKNLAIAVLNRFDRHLDPLWDHGHIKFWSVATLHRLLKDTGFSNTQFHRVGRIPMLAKSMIAVAQKP
jgi:2-polyprenyl-3-methyl-5-hydroxy-6-metoxy-1,4-benzoquinol methylase